LCEISDLITEYEIDEPCVGEIRNAYSNLVGKPEGKRPLGRPRHDGKIILE
jgi:hypothetical protein